MVPKIRLENQSQAESGDLGGQSGSGVDARDWSLSADASAPAQEQSLTYSISAHCPYDSKHGGAIQFATLGPASHSTWES